MQVFNRAPLSPGRRLDLIDYVSPNPLDQQQQAQSPFAPAGKDADSYTKGGTLDAQDPALQELLRRYLAGGIDLETLLELVTRRLGEKRQANDLGQMKGSPWGNMRSLGSNGFSPNGNAGTTRPGGARQDAGVTPVNIPAGANQPLTGESKATAEKLNAKLGGVFKGKGETFVQAAKANGIDPGLLAAIAMHETGNGTSSAVRNNNNPGGLMNPKTNWQTVQRFATLDQGIHAMAQNLKKNYLGKGRTTIASIGAKYAPVGARNDPRGLNRHWIPTVTKLYQQMTA